MQILTLYAVSLITFLALDAVMLNTVIAPLFRQHLGAALLDTPRIVPALAFYAAYVAGVTYLAGLPALRDANPALALVHGALIGALAYGTYEFTNLATLRDWHWSMVATDLAWGTVLTGVSAWTGVLAARTLG